jgi:hypothetical protein
MLMGAASALLVSFACGCAAEMRTDQGASTIRSTSNSSSRPWRSESSGGEPLIFMPGDPSGYDEEATLFANNEIPIVSWGTNCIPLTDIIASQWDAYIDASAAQAKQYASDAVAHGRPPTILIRLDWEMNGSWSQWKPDNGCQPAGTTAQTYVQFYRYVVDRFRADGVTNVDWVWAPNIDGGSPSCQGYGSPVSQCMAQYYSSPRLAALKRTTMRPLPAIAKPSGSGSWRLICPRCRGSPGCSISTSTRQRPMRARTAHRALPATWITRSSRPRPQHKLG